MAFDGDAVVKIFSRMQFKASANTTLLKFIENRPPTFGQFFEAFIHNSGRTLRPGIRHVPK